MAERKSERIEEISLNGTNLGDIFDVSEAGIGFHSSAAYDEGTQLFVKMNSVDLHAKVVYCKVMKEGAHLGLKYINLKEEHKVAIREAVSGFSKGVPVTFSIKN